MRIRFKIIREGNDFSASADDGPSFFVGRRVPYEGNIGLYNIFGKSKLKKLLYQVSDYDGKHGFWAEAIEPTAVCEGKSFLTVNTYDRAAFTFGFGQFAAHVPNGDFVKYFRFLLSQDQAAAYFPGLELIDGRICRIDASSSPLPLESDTSTEKLMAYLNPDLTEVQDAEVLAAARLIHWNSTSKVVRDAQVDVMVETFQRYMRRADQKVGIAGRSADLCCVIADILHQGRGGKMTWQLVGDALSGKKPFDDLILIGHPRYEERRTSLRTQIVSRPHFATKVWDSGKEEFV